MVTCGNMPTSHNLPLPIMAWVAVEPRLPHLKSLHTQPIWREDTSCPRALLQSLRNVDQTRPDACIVPLDTGTLSGHLLCTCGAPEPMIHDDTHTLSMINLDPKTSLPVPYIPRRPWPGPQSRGQWSGLVDPRPSSELSSRGARTSGFRARSNVVPAHKNRDVPVEKHHRL